MRRDNISEGEYYHVFNRGVNKQVIFHDNSDWDRFLFLVVFFQLQEDFKNIGRLYKKIIKSVQGRALHTFRNNKIKDRHVDLVSFCLMPNHFHLILRERVEGGISKYMHRVLTSYSMYYNTKYSKSGHLFQGPYKAVHIESDVQLLHLSAYIHKNPLEFLKNKNKLKQYFYSSYLDYLIENRWGDLLSNEIIIGQFSKKSDYEDFVSSSKAKEIETHLE